MRFLHTADWHLGLSAKHAGAAAGRVRDERFAAARRIAAIAREEGVEFIVIAGDVFDANAPAPADIRAAAELLDGFPAPVYVIPGNHDPDVPGGPWEHRAWQEAQRVHCLRAPEAVALPDGTLFPCPLHSRWQQADPLGWIPPRTQEHGIRVGLAHGGLETFGGPVALDAAARRDLDYLALGDWHSVTAELGEGVRQAYSGTPEPDSFGQRDAGWILLVDIAAPGAAPRIEKRRTGRLDWRQRSVALAREGDARRLREEMEEEAGDHVLLDLEVEGELYPGDEAELERVAALLAERYFHGRLRRGRLWPAGSETDLPAGFPAQAAQRLRAQAEAGDEAAGRALVLLHRLAREAGA
jgi:DNA repair exonuclease SbcCD nuclease subunit